MAACATAAAVFVLFDGAVFSAVVIAFSIEIIGVAGSALRCVLGPAEGNVFVIVLVAGAASQACVVVTRIVAVTRVDEINWCPGLGGMTIITFRDGNKVIV